MLMCRMYAISGFIPNQATKPIVQAAAKVAKTAKAVVVAKAETSSSDASDSEDSDSEDSGSEDSDDDASDDDSDASESVSVA
jgi:hypothetical protein